MIKDEFATDRTFAPVVDDWAEIVVPGVFAPIQRSSVMVDMLVDEFPLIVAPAHWNPVQL